MLGGSSRPSRRSGPWGRGRPVRALTALSALAVAALLLAACGGSSSAKPKTSSSSTGSSSPSSSPSASPSAARKGGTVTFAEGPGQQPTFIFPMVPSAEASAFNIGEFENLLYPPLIWLGKNGGVGIDWADSVARSVTYSDGGRTVTIRLKNWNWSDGQPVSSRDLEFFMNLLEPTKQQYIFYSPGEFPDNVVSYGPKGPKTFVLHLNAAYNRTWFTEDELSQITPIPQHVWDRVSSSGKVGNYDQTRAGAKKVYQYLVAQAKDTRTYTTNPLWKVVDGAWRMESFTTSGRVVFVPNSHYSGTDKAKINKFVELPFTSDTAEFNVLRSGSIDVGYLPTADLAQRRAVEAQGFRLAPLQVFGINYIELNLTNPAVAGILKQLYVRQALQHLVDEQGIIKSVYHGFATPEYGPVPTTPASRYLSPLAHKPPYPFSVAAAKHLLSSHGWKVVPNGTDTCERPGTGPGDCGAGIHRGEPLSLNLLFSAGISTMQSQAEIYKSDASEAGVTINLRSEPFNSVVADVRPCSGSSSCAWELGEYGGWSFSGVPTGDPLFIPGAAANAGGYDNPAVTRDIRASLHSSSLAVFYRYEDTVIRQAPWIWVPDTPLQLTLVKTNLHGVTPQNPFIYIAPQDWYFTH